MLTRSNQTDFHWILGPITMVTFAFLGNTLFLTILVSMLSSTFSAIVSNATAEIQFRHAVLTLEGVKSDAIFAYQPPFNILAMLILVPLRFLVSPRWFHKIHVFSVRLLNLPLLLIIAVAERRSLWSADAAMSAEPGQRRTRPWFWEKWRITVHSDIQNVFDIPPPDSVLTEIADDDEMTAHLIRRQFVRQHTFDGTTREAGPRGQDAPKAPGRRDSIVQFPGLAQQVRGFLSESDELTDINSRLGALEESTQRIEEMLARLANDGLDDKESRAEEEAAERTGTLRDLDKTAEEQ
jgi:hypothetical protein